MYDPRKQLDAELLEDQQSGDPLNWVRLFAGLTAAGALFLIGFAVWGA